MRPTSTDSAAPSQTSFWKQFAVLATAIFVAYVVVFQGVEYFRRKDGPWELTFTSVDSSPALMINQPTLGISNVTVVFAAAAPFTNSSQVRRFYHGQVAPLELPFGRCVFLDTLFLPGSATCDFYGHEIQVLPRTMTIDGREHPWRNGEKILLTNQPSDTISPR